MSEFSPICISLVISLLVSLILLFLSLYVWPVVFSFIGQHIICLLIGGTFIYFLFNQLGMMDWFETLLSKVGFSVVGRTISSLLLKMGCSAGLSLAIGLAVRALLTAEEVPTSIKWMQPAGGDSGAEAHSEPAGPSSSEATSVDQGTSRNEASSSSVGASSGAEKANSGVDQASGSREKSALNERAEELIERNLKERKGDVGDGQRISDVRKAVEADTGVDTKASEFQLIQEMEKEAGSSKNKETPVTNLIFNEVKDHQGKILDGKGGGTCCENQTTPMNNRALAEESDKSKKEKE
jgi:hypothetical protein